MDLPPVPCKCVSLLRSHEREFGSGAYIAAGEVAALEHKVRDDAVEGGALVGANLVLARAELTEVGGRLGDDVVEEIERDAALLDCWRVVGQHDGAASKAKQERGVAGKWRGSNNNKPATSQARHVGAWSKLHRSRAPNERRGAELRRRAMELMHSRTTYP